MSLQAELVSRVLDLPVGERAELARQLILSLEPVEHDPDADTAWEAEIERRLTQVDRGEVELREWRQSVERIRRVRRSRDGDRLKETGI